MKYVLLSAVVIAALASACDAQDQATKDPKAEAKDPKAEAKDPKAEAKDPHAVPAKPAVDAPVTFTSLSGCLETCEAPGIIPTNRETCKLNCDTAYGAQPAGVGTGANADVIGTAATCLGRCYAAGSSPDACASGCKTAAAAAPSAPASTVLDSLGTCIQTCRANKELRPTNQATCELDCTQLARVAGPAQPAAAP